jgi:excisionase family DNA binding protein
VSAFTSPECPARLFTIQEAAEALRIPISWLYERTRRNAIPCRRIGKYVRFSQQDLNEIISSSDQPKKAATDRA